MLKIGIIGAGNISKRHINAFMQNKECEIVAISDINDVQAKKIATDFNIKSVYTDYHDILNDKSIDAVSIATPTFTHKEIALEAIKSNKHILCEKPPALNADETREIRNALKDYDKVFMFAMVRRFSSFIQYTKEYVESGKMGKVICAEAVRLGLISKNHGWFANKKLGGGVLRDVAIHELDSLLYIMGYPKATYISAFQSTINSSLPDRMKTKVGGYASADTNTYTDDTEDVIKGFITLDNGVNMIIKAGHILLSHKTGCYTEINGEKAGALMVPWGSDKKLSMYEISDDMYLKETYPSIPDNDPFIDEIDHFVDCCVNNKECIIKPDEAVILMEIIDGIYESARTGKPITLNN